MLVFICAGLAENVAETISGMLIYISATIHRPSCKVSSEGSAVGIFHIGNLNRTGAVFAHYSNRVQCIQSWIGSEFTGDNLAVFKAVPAPFCHRICHFRADYKGIVHALYVAAEAVCRRAHTIVHVNGFQLLGQLKLRMREAVVHTIGKLSYNIICQLNSHCRHAKKAVSALP